MSSKIFPSEIQVRGWEAAAATVTAEEAATTTTAWTVWKKSSMGFVGSDGFSVFDGEGRLAFRVDNYSRRSKLLLGELLLMDAVGRPLFALKPQILSIYDEWKVYGGGEERSFEGKPKSHLFTVRRNSILRHGGEDAVEVFMRHRRGAGCGGKAADYRIEGRFRKRSCEIRGRDGEVVARISRKKASQPSVMIGDDVFSLLVDPVVDPALMVAFVVVMDRVC
ncbi:Protein LURP-one-related 8 [Apostasia shenzhenica]|uniref:Protein LURP-one-related 8 n=1 Tax=Apostasia shenzhenica TaxID=1088818 RepID=A0A2I0AXN8_9ASPA|nr:Protein LURP-one-related 8 [Apostasia shenzhenica]